jgi:hypothetical protein
VVVPAGDAAALAAEMRALAGDDARREQMREAARARVGGMGPETYAADFEAFVQGLLAQPARRTAAALAARVAGAALLRAGVRTMPGPAAYVAGAAARASG